MWGKLAAVNAQHYDDIHVGETDMELWVGRDPECDVCVGDMDYTVSKRHCQVVVSMQNTTHSVDVVDNSSNGTFVNGELVGRGNRRSLEDGDQLTFVVPSLTHKSFSSKTAAYRFEMGRGMEKKKEVTPAELEILRKSVATMVPDLERLIKSSTEYHEAGGVLGTRASALVSALSDYGGGADQRDPATTKIIDVFKRVENMKQALHRKVEVMMTMPMQNFVEEEIKVALEKEKVLKPLKRKYEDLQSKLKKATDPFKLKRVEAKFQEVKNEYELQSVTYASKLQEISDNKYNNLNNWVMAYIFANLSFFRQGFGYLEELEAEMRTKTKAMEKQEEQQHQAHKRRIDNIKQIMNKKNSSSKRSAREKQGYLYYNKKPLWFVVSNGVLSYYKSWKESTPITQLNLVLCSVKASADAKTKFELRSPDEHFVLTAMSKTDLDDWLAVLNAAITFQLSCRNKNDSFATINARALNSPQQMPPLVQLQLHSSGNNKCADCNAPQPDWAVINYGVLICYQCSGVHRSLGAHISKVRSLTLDKWDDQTLELMKLMGNDKSNAIYEASVPVMFRKPSGNVANSDGSDSSGTASNQTDAGARSARETYIVGKYKDKLFLKTPSRATDTQELSKLLFQAVGSGEDDEKVIPAMVHMIALGADVNWQNPEEDGATILHFAVASGDLVITELLMHNDACCTIQDYKGWTPLHYAAMSDSPGCTKVLIQRGAKTDVKDNDGNTPLEIASKHDCNNVTILLGRSDNDTQLQQLFVQPDTPKKH
eukprot:TRINITY_DN1693_c0_g1_i2.p1 TRINITY_DN1693_c0_g1~~TRINITY_DN1693_c0_g1_i2.p1  ORF type:complete len:768 (+),score=245.16 TRINITY_DN1693_c0_g1_i2:238-2541(+)